MVWAGYQFSVGLDQECDVLAISCQTISFLLSQSLVDRPDCLYFAVCCNKIHDVVGNRKVANTIMDLAFY